MRRMITAGAAAAVLAPLLVLAAGAQSNAAEVTAKPTVVDLPLEAAPAPVTGVPPDRRRVSGAV
ncbi:hypothetical protein C2142_02730 [Streptomyces sp. CB01881]|nr:hypothetical protein C2142_02730 [Streptomyces sp. CB01881]